MDCRKLSVDACSHAAQNDRLPLRTVMQVTFIGYFYFIAKFKQKLLTKNEQVLFAEQVKLRATMQINQQTVNADSSDQVDTCSSPKEEIKMLKRELEKMAVLIEDLQSDYKNLQHDCENMGRKQNALSSWILGWNKLKKSTLFKAKSDSTENREVKEKEKRMSSMLRLKRRQSMS